MRASVTVQAAQANQPPVVNITSPASGATITGADVTLQAAASDPDGTVAKVEFFEGRTSLGAATSSPFQVTVHLEPGLHNISAQATDNAGASASSGVVAITVTLPNVAPTVSITSPTNSATFALPATISLQAQAADSDGTVSKVEFFAGDQSLGSASAAPYTVSWTNAAPGDFTITAKATDNAGATTTSEAVQIHVAGELTAPTIANVQLAGGTFQFDVQSKAGQAYMVQISPDLKNWTLVKEVTATEDLLKVTDTPPAGPQSFYRVQVKQ